MRTLLRVLGGLLALLLLASVTVWFRFLQFEAPDRPSLPGRFERETFVHDDRERSVQIYRPAEKVASPGLVIAFHGSDGDGDRVRGGFGYRFDELAEREGLLIAYPDGFERHWNGCRRNGPYAANLEKIDDVGFTLALIERLVASDGVDPERVFATGVSNGGQMALRLALEAPQAFRAVGPVIASLPAGGNMDCRPAGRPISVVILNGTGDPMNPYEGGRVALHGLVGDRGEVLSTADTLDYWRETGSLAPPPDARWLEDSDDSDGSRIQEILYEAPGRPRVALLAVHGGGHTVPHPLMRMPRLLGETNRDHRAADLLWDFFAAAPPRSSYAKGR